MTSIIIPTDFSSASDNAMHYGAQLAQKIGASVLLTHVYEVPVSINDVPVMVLPIEELKNSADIGLERCREELRKVYPELEVQIESRLGGINDVVNDLCEENPPFAIVMGTHGSSGFERMLFGSTTLSFIRHAHYPVIAVPSNYKEASIQKIVLATDLNTEKIPYAKIMEIVGRLKAQLHVVHITKEQEEYPSGLLEPLQTVSPVYRNILNKEVKDGLLNYVKDNDADLLMILPHEHNIMERLFFKLHTEDIIASTRVPVLAIRS
jgi:nucleotide-binding universal stress UspA family protein